MNSNEQTKIKPSIVVVHVVRMNNGTPECLLLRRCSSLQGNWQMVSGKVEPDEKFVEAVKRELFEETGLIADKLFSADFIETYFDARYDAVFMAPVFVAFINTTQEIKLSPSEHDQYKWLEFSQAMTLLDFSGQRNALKHIHEQFFMREPSNYLLIT